MFDCFFLTRTLKIIIYHSFFFIFDILCRITTFSERRSVFFRGWTKVMSLLKLRILTSLLASQPMGKTQFSNTAKNKPLEQTLSRR